MIAPEQRQAPEPNGRSHRLPRWHHVMLAFGCALVLSLMVSSYFQFSLSMEALASLQFHRERSDRVDALLIDLLDAETGVRGFRITGNEEYLEPYRNALPRISELMPKLRADTQAQPETRAIFDSLQRQVDIKLAVLAAAVTSSKPPPGASVEGVGTGKVAMDEIRGLLALLSLRATVDGARSISDSLQYLRVTRWVTISLGLGAMLLLIAMFSLILRQIHLRGQIADLLQGENQRLEEQVSRRTAELSMLASYLSNVREIEKGRLARELHDEMGAILTSAKMDAGWIARTLDASAMNTIRERFDRLVKQLNEGIKLKRRIIDNLRPPLLEELGLTASLQAMVDEFRASTGKNIAFDSPPPEPNISSEKTLALFRIAQEALTNIRKYAQANCVQMALWTESGTVHLKVVDDGRGFDPSEVSGTHGIAGMKYRVQMFGGRFSIVSAPSQGTQVEVTIPI